MGPMLTCLLVGDAAMLPATVALEGAGLDDALSHDSALDSEPLPPRCMLRCYGRTACLSQTRTRLLCVEEPLRHCYMCNAFTKVPLLRSLSTQTLVIHDLLLQRKRHESHRRLDPDGDTDGAKRDGRRRARAVDGDSRRHHDGVDVVPIASMLLGAMTPRAMASPPGTGATGAAGG
jgi:hypothetical protein